MRAGAVSHEVVGARLDGGDRDDRRTACRAQLGDQLLGDIRFVAQYRAALSIIAVFRDGFLPYQQLDRGMAAASGLDRETAVLGLAHQQILQPRGYWRRVP